MIVFTFLYFVFDIFYYLTWINENTDNGDKKETRAIGTFLREIYKVVLGKCLEARP